MKLKNKKTGEVVDFGYLQSDHVAPLVLTTYENDKPKMYKYNSLAELNSEWEDYKEPKTHWTITEFGDAADDVDGYMPETIDEMKKIGNYFESKEEAEKAVEKLKAWKRLKDKGFRLSAVVDTFFCLDIFMKGEPYEAIKDDLKIVFGGDDE
jgi:hypothetical protein